MVQLLRTHLGKLLKISVRQPFPRILHKHVLHFGILIPEYNTHEELVIVQEGSFDIRMVNGTGRLQSPIAIHTPRNVFQGTARTEQLSLLRNTQFADKTSRRDILTEICSKTAPRITIYPFTLMLRIPKHVSDSISEIAVRIQIDGEKLRMPERRLHPIF